MDKLKAVISLMAKSATEENKTEEFLETMKALKRFRVGKTHEDTINLLEKISEVSIVRE